jgi:hypothetical protein
MINLFFCVSHKYFHIYQFILCSFFKVQARCPQFTFANYRHFTYKFYIFLLFANNYSHKILRLNFMTSILISHISRKKYARERWKINFKCLAYANDRLRLKSWKKYFLIFSLSLACSLKHDLT